MMFILVNDIDKAPAIILASIRGRNPNKRSYVDARMAAGIGPGLSVDDHVYRDPFGNPYIVTIDINSDDKCVDAFYSSLPGDGKLKGLIRDNNNKWELNAPVMIWSKGPDGQASAADEFNKGSNKDNILSWQ